MLHSGLVKFMAVFCLLLQVWGGTGLDRIRICIRPTEPTPVRSCAAGCCSKKAPAIPVDAKLLGHGFDGCCLQAKLPDEPVQLPTFRGGDVPSIAVVDVPASIEPVASCAAREPERSPPGAHKPGVASCLASTRLRL